MSILDDILPSQRYDEAPVTAPLRQLLQALSGAGGEPVRVSIELDAGAWRKLEMMWRRPYRPHASATYLALDVGTVEFRRRQETAQEVPQQDGPAYLQRPIAFGSLTGGDAVAMADHEMEWPSACDWAYESGPVACARAGCGRPPNEHPVPKAAGWSGPPAVPDAPPPSSTYTSVGPSGIIVRAFPGGREVAAPLPEPSYDGPWKERK